MATPTQSLRLAGISLIGLICVGFSANLSAKLKVTGLDSAQEKNVRAWLSLDKLAEKADRRAVFRRYRMADKEIGSALQALGYYSPKIKRQLKYDEDQSWLAQFDIKAGERTTIQSFDIRFSGPGAAAIREVYSAPALLGEPLHHDRYRLLKEQLLNLAFSQGYLDAEITTSKLVIDPPKARAEIELVLETGMAFYFGDIDIQQNILNKEFLDRYVQIQSGDAFNPDRLLDLQLRLSDLDYFSNLDVSTERSDEDPPRISVSILATPKPPQHYQFGFGYGTDTGPRASLLTEFRHLNRNGHRLRSDLRIAESQQSWSARYLIPAGNEAGSNWSLKAAFSAEDFADARSESWQWTLARTRLSGASLWQYYGTYEIESFRLGDNPRKDTELLMPGISLTLREADNDLNPRKGFKVFADMHAAHADIASSDSFIQGLLQARYIHPLSNAVACCYAGSWAPILLGIFQNYLYRNAFLPVAIKACAAMPTNP